MSTCSRLVRQVQGSLQAYKDAIRYKLKQYCCQSACVCLVSEDIILCINKRVCCLDSWGSRFDWGFKVYDNKLAAASIEPFCEIILPYILTELHCIKIRSASQPKRLLWQIISRTTKWAGSHVERKQQENTINSFANMAIAAIYSSCLNFGLFLYISWVLYLIESL